MWKQDVHTDLAQALQEYWDEYAGIRPPRVRVISGEGAIVVWLEEVLSPAERQMASTQEGRKVLQELEERILEQARPQLQQLVEGAVGRESTQAEVHIDVANGSVLGFFRLG
ncbi:Na-translocating system protein MpsC family protein [Chloroflexota bacterium]